MVLIFGTLPALAAENTINLTGGGIVIDADTPSTVWTDQTGGTLTWNKDTGTLTFNDFNYNVSVASQNAGGGFCFETVSDIVLNGTSEISCSDKVYRTVRLENCPKISGSGKLTVKGPVIEPDSAEKMFSPYSAAYIEAVGGSFILNSGTLEVIGGTGAGEHSAESVSEWNTGLAAYLLNGGLHDNTYIWRQTIGKDDFPNFSGSKVYRSGKNSFTSEKPSAFVFTDGSTVTAEQIDKPCVLIAASYSGDKLTDVKIKNISENTNLTFDEMNLNRQNADSICVMLWNERENMTPLCGADKFIVE